MVDLQADIFVLPTRTDTSIIYSPLRGTAFYANQEAVKIVAEFYDSGLIPLDAKGTEIYNHLIELSQIKVDLPKKEDICTNTSDGMFILSQICNLACSYCYAANSRAKETLSKEHIKVVVDSICSNTDLQNKKFSFIGGGEPLATWDLFVWAINYINTITELNGFTRRIGLTTNGTLLDEERIQFLKENKIVISVSFDILPDVQDEQRPFPGGTSSSFVRVHNNIKMLLENNLVPRIRSTITSRNVNLMFEMVEFAIRNYPEISVLHFEPVTDINDNHEQFYKTYISGFEKAKRIAEKHNVNLKNSITHSFNRIRTRFCNGETCITPSSDIVSCHRISSSREENFEAFKYGKVSTAVEVNITSLDQVRKIFDQKYDECSTCFAKWHCAGGCPMYRTVSTTKEQEAYCYFVKETLTSVLDERLNA